MPAALLFDLDGTLVDSEDLHFRSTSAVLAARGVQLEADDFAIYEGWDERACWLHLIDRFALPDDPLVLMKQRTDAVVTDMEMVAAHSLELIANSDHLVAPLGIIQLGGSSDMVDAMRSLLRRGPSTVVATMGSQGSAGLAVGSGTPEFADAVPCDVVDTTGAGDAYHAGYLAGLLRGEPLAERLRFASAWHRRSAAFPGPG